MNVSDLADSPLLSNFLHISLAVPEGDDKGGTIVLKGYIQYAGSSLNVNGSVKRDLYSTVKGGSLDIKKYCTLRLYF
ncbi:Uncharacterised protein [Klebsiella variicola]|uniref:Uncharacterized protein n=1 Tax=Klebsiella variicola TaxID=244366 RepID=A0ABD7P1L1_KLEVA|nr:Uncharacterised protein [Klebsiella variicola]